MGVKKIIRKIIKKVWGVDGISLFIKKQKKNINKQIYRKKYSADDLVGVMCTMGMQQGSVVFIHSAMTEFYNYTGTAEELINKIIEVIGEEGTLMMPAYPPNKAKLYQKAIEDENAIVFDVLDTPSGAGYLTEVFRKYPGVKRSINLQHSVCVYGKLAEYFTNEHHLSETAWDEYSPYYKLGQVNGLIFSLGLEPYLRNVTLIHCTETILRNKYLYFNSFFGKKITYTFLDVNDKKGEQTLLIPIKGGVRSKKIIKKYFEPKYYKINKISNLLIEVIDSKYMLNKCIELADKGISIYSKPTKENYIKDGKFIKFDEYKN